MNIKNFRGLIFSSLVFLINIILFFSNHNFYDFIFLNTVMFAGIFDFYKMIIPDTTNLIILTISIINFDIYNLIYAFFILFITLVLYNQRKFGFGDVKLLTTITMYIGFDIFYIIILSMVIVVIFNFNKKEIKLPYGFYIMLSIIGYYFIEVIS